MFVLPLPFTYLGAMAIWLVVLLGLFYALLRFRQICRTQGRRMWLANSGLSIAMLLAAVTAGELGFACFADFSDTFNITNVSKRWLVLHIDSEWNNVQVRDRNPLNKFVGPGQKRIIFVGDSFTAGHGIKNIDNRFTDRIAAWLEEKAPGKYVVSNYAEPGLEASMIEGKIKALFKEHYDVNMVVYVYNLNDIEGYAPKTIEQLQQINTAEPQNFLLRDTYLLNWLYFRYVQFKFAKGTDYFKSLASAYDGEPWKGTPEKPALRAKLTQLRSECAENNVDFRMVIFPFVQSLGKDDIFRDARAKIVGFCKAEKVPVLDLQPVLNEHTGEKLEVSRFDAHPNERAHAIAAEAIEKDLFSDLVAPPHP